uniref:hypothetical protein n=1 Tax=Mesorhizobium caraganae TaxID=483206 RepID=UPI001AEF3489
MRNFMLHTFFTFDRADYSIHGCQLPFYLYDVEQWVGASRHSRAPASACSKFTLGADISVWDDTLNPEFLAEIGVGSIALSHGGLRGANLRFGEREFPASFAAAPRLRRVRPTGAAPWSTLGTTGSMRGSRA